MFVKIALPGSLKWKKRHGPGATGRNVRRRFADVAPLASMAPAADAVEIRDLALYEQMLEAA